MHDWRNGGDPAAEAEPGSFAARLPARRVDLVALVREGVPPREYHSHSAGMLVRGKRHQIAAPAKSGKSLVCLVHCTRMALAGERIVVLDRENGADEYAGRLEQIMDAWQLGEGERATVGRNLSYYEYPTLRRNDADELVAYLHDELAADLVAFDSQRMFLTDYGLAEAVADDYARFMSFAIDPLHRAGITTLILDNTGHSDTKRARGSSTKGDLNEVLFNVKEVQPFDRHTRGIVELGLERSRFGDRGSWRMAIGGGVFGEWQSDDERVLKVAAAKPEFKEVVYRTLRAAGGRAMGQHKLARAVRDAGVPISNTNAGQLFRQWAADSNEPLRHSGEGYVVDQ
jgi:hypothetical protein